MMSEPDDCIAGVTVRPTSMVTPVAAGSLLRRGEIK